MVLFNNTFLVMLLDMLEHYTYWNTVFIIVIGLCYLTSFLILVAIVYLATTSKTDCNNKEQENYCKEIESAFVGKTLYRIDKNLPLDCEINEIIKELPITSIEKKQVVDIVLYRIWWGVTIRMSHPIDKYMGIFLKPLEVRGYFG